MLHVLNYQSESSKLLWSAQVDLYTRIWCKHLEGYVWMTLWICIQVFSCSLLQDFWNLKCLIAFLYLLMSRSFQVVRVKAKVENCCRSFFKNRQYGMEEPFHKILLYLLQQSTYHMYCVLFTSSLKCMYQISLNQQ